MALENKGLPIEWQTKEIFATPGMAVANQDFDLSGHGRVPVQCRVDKYNLFILFYVVISSTQSIVITASCGILEMLTGAGQPFQRICKSCWKDIDGAYCAVRVRAR